LPVTRDPRDLRLASFSEVENIVGPPVVDLRKWCGPIKDQGPLGACTAFAGSSAMEWLMRRYESIAPVFSPMFLYAVEREHDGTPLTDDGGSTDQTTCWCLHHQGVCLESADPYQPRDFTTPPTPEQLTEAALYKITGYHALTNGLPDVINCLACGYPALFGFTVYDSFESAAVASSGIIPMPGPDEQILGGHETLIVGKDDPNKMLLVQNSWGAGWGDSGYFHVPYAVFQALVLDCRLAHL